MDLGEAQPESLGVSEGAELPGPIDRALRDYQPEAREPFRADMRAAFVSGSIRATGVDAGQDAAVPIEPEPSGSEEDLPAHLKAALDSYQVPAPSSGYRESLRSSFVAGSLGEGAGTDGAPLEGAGQPAEPTAMGPKAQSSSPPRHEKGSTRRRIAPQPARRMSTQLRLLSGVALMAAAAALFLIFGKGESPPSNGTPGTSGGGDHVAQGGPQERPAPGGQRSPWTLDLGGLDESEVLASVLVDGAVMDSIAALEMSLGTAKLIEVGELADRVGDPDQGSLGGGIRIQRMDEYVLDLASGTALELQHKESESELRAASGGEIGDARTVLFARSGAVRVATGPGFDRENPLVLRTPHVRTQVMGTIYGVDIGEGYTCVCCLSGSVIADPCQGEFPALTVPRMATRVLLASGERPQASPLHGGHRGPLDALEGYWL